MKKHTRTELSKMNKNNLINLVIELEQGIILHKNMVPEGGRPKIKVTKEMENNILFLHNQGKGTRYIGEYVGISHTKVAQILKNMVQ